MYREGVPDAYDSWSIRFLSVDATRFLGPNRKKAAEVVEYQIFSVDLYSSRSP